MKIDVLGVGVDDVDRAGLMAAVARLLERGERSTIAYANVHVLHVAYSDLELRAFLHGADVVYCDGQGVVLGARLLGRHLPERMTGADWIKDLAAVAEDRRWRIYWMGGKPGVTVRAAHVLRRDHPDLHIDADHGFHTDNDALIARINAARPHILLVGMGTPLQERWVAAHRARIDAPIVWVTGATADFVSGEVSRGPAFLHSRQEWLARLLVDPRRLAGRYLVGNALFLARITRAKLTESK